MYECATFWWRAVGDWDNAANWAMLKDNTAELLGKMFQSITEHAYRPTVWAACEVVQEQV